ncbi:hypothetical protein LINGRAHAP2_LOCUS24282 [Linum grandiflorum]
MKASTNFVRIVGCVGHPPTFVIVEYHKRWTR